MRRFGFSLLVIAGLAWGAMPARSAPEGWHTSMKDGLAASVKSGRPALVVTGWKSGV